MDADKLTGFAMFYFAIIMPIILFIISVIVGANLLWFLLFLGWLGAGFMLVFLPTHPDQPGT